MASMLRDLQQMLCLPFMIEMHFKVNFLSILMFQTTVYVCYRELVLRKIEKMKFMECNFIKQFDPSTRQLLDAINLSKQL